jgi:hypothetical protein
VFIPDFETFLDRQSTPTFRTPIFFGHSTENAIRLGAWAFIRGRPPRLDGRSADDMRRLLEALAGVAALSQRCRNEVKAVHDNTPWVEPIAGKIQALLQKAERRTDPSFQDLLREVEAFRGVEDRVVTRCKSLGHPFLTHIDIKAVNLIIPPDNDRIVLLDWTGVRFCAPGVALRFLAHHDQKVRAEAVACYVECMRRFGCSVDSHDVQLGLEAAEVFRNLGLALGRESVEGLRAALALARTCRSILP